MHPLSHNSAAAQALAAALEDGRLTAEAKKAAETAAAAAATAQAKADEDGTQWGATNNV